ncbi:MAG TPA: heme exporter protein CcmD [Candidatus Saccharimonadia bacterium]|nr:heme exporter protein CcmD [Candidatus Saccharimonadia bacterium]
MSHTPFIVAAYLVFVLVFAADALSPLLARRKALSRLRSRLQREQRRGDAGTPPA